MMKSIKKARINHIRTKKMLKISFKRWIHNRFDTKNTNRSFNLRIACEFERSSRVIPIRRFNFSFRLSVV
ncbi:hypothetical protein HanLR1_Chr16g0645511 [Helianthus annuus]|nr:hypothetical protein HanLR1_Chr16g0645511 [Helianthus annuus]